MSDDDKNEEFPCLVVIKEAVKMLEKVHAAYKWSNFDHMTTVQPIQFQN